MDKREAVAALREAVRVNGRAAAASDDDSDEDRDQTAPTIKVKVRTRPPLGSRACSPTAVENVFVFQTQGGASWNSRRSFPAVAVVVDAVVSLVPFDALSILGSDVL